ncbi:ssDNA-binding Zn-finger/Zn-ribbon topoisomerase 1 [Methanococcus voltae]|uniref:topoisomerase DNA-binding C4 zinc finger domain-containing protein n=1 Tax=Methanococcus voltae TaxID=2188 RepID=UPI001AE86D06|nr:topoisomerase DNA-binding C4 zinc finger domain-containing protein [Methanococcus voltae]MBP2143186.1 ssDNA-binding Zn-finger/Zn-ribbon topoisomerase 1 [Methanococcus voltae]
MGHDLFKELTKNIHFNVTELDKNNFGQDWQVPECLVSMIGIKNGKKPVFYYGITQNYRTSFIIKKGKSENGNNFINARVYLKFDKDSLIEKEKYIVGNGFNGLLLAVKISKPEFIATFKNLLLEDYSKNDIHVKDVLDRIKDRNELKSIEESAEYIANRDYEWLIGRIKYMSKMFNYSGEGFWLLPLKTESEITKGLCHKNDELIIDLENAKLFENYLVYVDVENEVIRYNGDRLCKNKNTLTDELKNRSDDVCPWCGSALRTIKTKKGEFLGCTDYPKCLYRRYLNKKY